MTYKAIALCRVSTTEQRKNNSLNRQEENVYKAAAQLGVEIAQDGWWSGNVSSKAGTNVKRKDLNEMLVYCKHNKGVQYLIVDEPDRFMRSIDEAFYFEVRFRELGVTVWYASDASLNTGDLMAKMLKFSKYLPAEGSNIERQHKSINGHIKALTEGRYTFPPKPGYIKGEKPGIHQPHPIEFEPFQRALKEVISGIYSPSEALKRLNDSDFTNSRYPLKIDKFSKFIADPYYAGIIDMDLQVKAHSDNAQHTAMISVDEHERIKDIVLGRRKHKYQRKEQNPEFPMNQTLCDECDGKLVGFNHNNGKGWVKPKYRCRNCNKQYIRDTVHSAMDEVLRPLGLDDDSRSNFIAALTEVWEQKQQGNLQQIRILQGRLNELMSTKDQLVRRLATVPASLQKDIEDSIIAIKLESKDVEQEIVKASDIQNDLVEFVSFALKFTDQLIENWWELSHENRLRCKQLLFPEGFSFSSSGKVYTPQISPLYRLATTKKNLDITRDSLLVELPRIALGSVGLLARALQV